MKKIRIVIALLPILCLSKVWAQEVEHGESFVLNGTLNASQTFEYRASNFIQLGKGFYSSPQSPNYAMIEIDPFFNPETPWQNMYWQPEDCMDMGRLGFYPMDFDVNENGAAVINMPLEFPEGINGMTPHLSLNYNSQAGNGIMGLGWSLGGMSKISRVPYTYMYNDSCHAVRFTNADELSIDGVVLRKGQKDGSVCYYPEIYDYSIIYPINLNGSIDNGFRVLKKDGMVYTYDAKYYLQSQIETPIEWHLSRMEDPFGNYVEYEYENDTAEGAFYPTSIRYTGHSGMTPQYEIVFHYDEHDTRNDCPRKWFSKPGQYNKTGYSRITKKLDGVECWFEGRKIMSYKLTYVTLDWNIRALSYVKKAFFDDNEGKWSYNTLIPTRFLWKETDYQLQYDSVQVATVSNTFYNYFGRNWYQFAAFAARFEKNKPDGTQKYEQDIVHLMKRNNGAKSYHLNIYRSGNAISEQGQHYQFDSYDCSYFNDPKNGFFADSRSVIAFMPADTDGDGLNEIVCVYHQPSNETTNISLIKYDETRGFYDTVVNSNLGNPNYYAANSFRVGDFNGDGLSDLFCIFNNSPHVWMSMAEAPFSVPVSTECYSDSNRRIEIGDFNGDKKDQIVILMKNQNPTAKLFRIVANSNAGFVMTQQSLPSEIAGNYYSSTSNPCYRMCSGDFNGDGKKDILLQCHQSWRFYFSQGNGLFADPMLVTDTTYTEDSFVATNENNTNLPNITLVADLDDDGCDDISIMKVDVFIRPSVNVPNHTIPYRGAFRRDFLIRPTGNGSVRIRTIKNLRSWWHNGNLLHAERCIDSIVYDTTVASSKTNPFLPILGNHKGTAPTEIMCCCLYNLDQPENLGVSLHNTGCLDNTPLRAVKTIVTSLGATTDMEYRPVSYQFARNEIFGLDDVEATDDSRSLTAVLPYYGYMNVVEKVMTETMDDSSPGSQPSKIFRKTRYHFSRPYYHTRGRGFLGFKMNWSRQQGQRDIDDLFTKRTYRLDEAYSVLVPDSSDIYRFILPNQEGKTFVSRTSFSYAFQNDNVFDAQLGSIPNGVFAPYLNESVTTRTDDSPIIFEKEIFEKNGFGNVVNHEHHYGTSANSFPYYEKKDVSYDNSIGANRWIIGIPQTETLIQKLCQEENLKVIRRNLYENNMVTGRHVVKCTEPGDEKQLKETFAYDAFGNIISIVSEGSGVVRKDSIVYTDDGRFPKAKINTLGQATTFAYDEATGRLDSITDPNGLVTRYQYDILGNLIQTEYPTGVLENQSMWWVRAPQSQTIHPDAPHFGGPVYFTHSKRSGERESYVFYDQHNRKLREVSSNMNGHKIFVDYKYQDISGLLWKVSNPYFPEMNETPQFSTYQYDYLGRNTRIDRADGGFISKVYLGETETTIGFDGQKTTLYYTKSGLVEFALRYDGTTNHTVATQFSHYGDGKVKTTNAMTYHYDINRNPLSVTDPSLGELTYDYNAFGELTHSTTPRAETGYAYDALGRMTQRNGTDGDSRWNYDIDFIGTLSNTVYVPATGPVVKENFSYDGFGRLTRQTQKLDDEAEWEFSYTYDRLGRQNSITYPSGKKFKYHYNGNGFMEWVRDAATGEVIWQGNTSDRWNNISAFTQGDIEVKHNYDPVTGMVTNVLAMRNGQPLLDQSYHWTITGNLEWRTDETLDFKERFGYDGYNRLVSATTRNLAETQTYSSQSFGYDFRGNITQKSGVGNYAYNNNSNPYAVTKLIPENGQESLFENQTATYTGFDKLRSLEQYNKRLVVDYGIDRQRVRQTYLNGSNTRTKRHFTPLYESITENGVTKNLHYLTAANGLFAIFATQSNGTSAMHYTLKDHQGSLTATICGNAVERLSYDAWGRRRNPNGFGYNNVTTTFDRGYTLHEHYDGFNLINMNGRMYDPVIGRMLSPDIAIQDEYNLQAYNRYSYCFNNPLRFTDPSGYVVQMPFEYYGLETFGYGYFERHSFKDSSFNTEATEGMQRPEDDWFENEETGAIYYNSNMRKGDEGKGGMKGSGWKWLGKNGMFSESFIGLDSYLVANYGGRFSIDDSGIWEMELFLNGSQAKGMMASVGYKQVNTQEIVYSDTYDQSISDGRHSFKFTYGTSIAYSEKVGYVPAGFEEISRIQLGNTLYGNVNHNTGAFPEVSRYSISYGSPSFLRKVGRAIQIGRGIHDYVNYYDGGSVNSYIESGAPNSLVNRFLRKHPK